MGGDAFPEEVEKMASFLHEQTVAKVKVGWYSGKPDLPANFKLSHFHYIKLGPYNEKLGGLKNKKTNQRLYKIKENQLLDITDSFWKE